MRIAKLFLASISILIWVLAIALAATALTNRELFLILGVCGVASLLQALIFWLYLQHRQVRQENNILKNKVTEIAQLNEQRYEHTRQRLDRILITLGEHPDTSFASTPTRQNPSSLNNINLASIDSRIRRFERQVLGLLQNELFANNHPRRESKDVIQETGQERRV